MNCGFHLVLSTLDTPGSLVTYSEESITESELAALKASASALIDAIHEYRNRHDD